MNEPPHILHVFSTFMRGGPQVRTCALINALSDRFRHTIMACDGDVSAAPMLQSTVAAETIPPPPGKGSVFYSFSFAGEIRRLRPDLLLTYNWGAFDALLAGAVTRVCPVIHTEDGFGADEAKSLKIRRVWSRRLAFPFVEAVVVPSKTLLNIAVSRYGMRRERVCYIANGADCSRFHPRSGAALRAKLKIPDDACVFGYVGRMSPEKNVEMLLRAFAPLAGPLTRLLIVGDGPCRQDLERAAAALGLSKLVIFAGAIPDPAPWYNVLDVFTLSSATEQMPVSLVEAMCSGLPAICTNVGDVGDILGTSEFPFVIAPGDVNEFSVAMRTLASDALVRTRQGAENRGIAEKRFALKAMVDCYEKVYRSALKLDRRPTRLPVDNFIGHRS